MTVYIESNFVIERALQQEECDSCYELIELAATGRIVLVVPAFSLAEPHVAISAKEKVRSRLSNELRGQLAELGRSKWHRNVPANFGALAAVLVESAKFERDGLRDAVAALIQSAEVIALDGAILKAAAEMQLEFSMSGQDAIVLSSILSHLDLWKPGASCFLNRNSKDFDDPGVRERLEVRGCKLFVKFSEGLRYVNTRIAAA